MKRILIPMFALAALAAAPARADLVVTLTVPAFSSPTFTNTLGSGSFRLGGGTRVLDLAPGVATIVSLDDTGFGSLNGPTTNDDPTVTFVGTIFAGVSLGGVTQLVPFNFEFTPAGQGAKPPLFLPGSPVAFDLPAGVVTLTPVGRNTLRSASLLFTPTAAVPEPASMAMLGLGGLGLLGYARRRGARATA